MQAEGLVAFRVVVRETDLHIQAECDLSAEARAATERAREILERHIAAHPEFRASLKPLAVPGPMPPLLQRMYNAATAAGVGPMAAVAGAVAEFVGRELLRETGQVIVENGGDIFLKTDAERVIAVDAGRSPLSGKVGLRIPAGSTLGVCTSSATVGPSLSLGKADAALIVAEDAAFADAAASALGNRVGTAQDIEPALAFIRELPGVLHALIIIDDRLGTWGQFDLTKVRP
jgi:ApbE superfamily uncharacterized protein (UPF0280 family)